jgi:hypothetical protein
MTTENRNILLGSIALIIIIVGIIFVGKQKAAAPGEQAALEEATKDWEIWESGTYNSDADESTMYTVSHPKDFVVSKRATAKGGFLKNPLVTMAFPKGAFAEPKSTYSEGYATISSSKSKNTEERCFTIPGEATGEFTDVTTWNDLKVKRVDASDPGAGNLYTSRIYRTLFDGTCYEVALTVHTTNIDNYEAGTVVEFDKEQAFSVLENIRMTFGLRKEAGPLK